MNKKINVLVFPCGSEIGLEIHRSLKFSRHINLIGANSIPDHGRFVYETYIGELPFIDSPGIIETINDLVDKYDIDALYPTMDFVINFFKLNEHLLNCKVIASPHETTEICISKLETYKKLGQFVNVPKIFWDISDVKDYPVFMKPVIGYGSRGAKKINNFEEAIAHSKQYDNLIITEYLPGDEFTVDCFSNKDGELLYFQARKRARISNGISVNTYKYDGNRHEIGQFAHKINNNLSFCGSWFFQIKYNSKNQFVLLEVASRLGGSSSLSRNLGVNFAMLSIFDAFDISTQIIVNDYYIELDRALDNKYKINLNYERAYIDFDDCLIIDNKVNISMVSFIYNLINKNIDRILITKHEKDIMQSLKEFNLENLFSKIIHLKTTDRKVDHISNPNKAIFIDDAFSERREVYEHFGMSVFAPDAVESLF